MPENHEAVEMTSIDLQGVPAVVPVGARLLNSQWKYVDTTSNQRRDVAAIIVVFGDNWLTKLFAEAWSDLPARLASLAIRPPAANDLSLRSNLDPLQFAKRMPTGALSFPMWGHLVELTRSGLRVDVQVVPVEWTSADALEKVTEIDDRHLPELLSSPPHRELDWLFNELHLARLSDLCGEVVSPADATAVLAGLWLLHGDADASHRQSQSIEDEGRHRCGNFWHAIMHRQEPDYGNSKYWFRRVGQHPIFPELARRAAELIAADGSDSTRRWGNKLGLPSGWDPFAFVDWCESALAESDRSQVRLIRRI
ncbi:MAG: hypothetical protein FD138_199, partial [Planctomycetota bacterium]